MLQIVIPYWPLFNSSQLGSQFRNKNPNKWMSIETKNQRNKSQEQNFIWQNLQLEQLYFSCGANGTEMPCASLRNLVPRAFSTLPDIKREKSLGTRLPVLVPLLAYGNGARMARGSELSYENGTISRFLHNKKSKDNMLKLI